jgi:hypothetical protein
MSLLSFHLLSPASFFSGWSVLCFTITGIVVGTVTHQWGFAAIYFVFALFALLWRYWVRRRVAFAAANLEVATEAVKEYPATIYSAFLMLFMHLLWNVIWIVAVIGIAGKFLRENDTGCNTGSSSGSGNAPHGDCRESNPKLMGFIGFLLLVSFFWGAIVDKYVLHATVAGTVGAWWAVQQPRNPVWGAFKRACTTSFGSIAFGALIIAVINALKSMANSSRRQNRRRGNNGAALCACIVGCILRCLGAILEYVTVSFRKVALRSFTLPCCFLVSTPLNTSEVPRFVCHRRSGDRSSLNWSSLCFSFPLSFLLRPTHLSSNLTLPPQEYAIVFVSLYGVDFKTAGRRVLTMFKDRGWTTIINDSLIDRALALGMFLVAAINAAVGAAIAWSFVRHRAGDQKTIVVIVCAFVGFFIGFGLCAIVTGVVESAVKTVVSETSPLITPLFLYGVPPSFLSSFALSFHALFFLHTVRMFWREPCSPLHYTSRGLPQAGGSMDGHAS